MKRCFYGLFLLWFLCISLISYDVIRGDYEKKVNLNRNEETYNLYKATISLGYTEEQAQLFIDQCKMNEREESYARRCGVWIAAIGIAESNGCKNGNNCRGLMKNGKIMEFETSQDAVQYWIERYYTYRYKHEKPSDWINKSKYCIDDGGGLGCPNWKKNTTRVLNHFRFYFDDI